MIRFRNLLAFGALAASAALAPSPAAADRYRLADGQSFEASSVGEADGVTIVLTHQGKELRLPSAGVASVESGAAIPQKLEAKLARARHNFRVDRRRAATK